MMQTSSRWRLCVVTMSLIVVGVGFALAPAAQARSSKPKPPPPSTSRGYDVSYPQCGQPLPSSALFGIVGVNNGIVYTANPCASTELAWAQQTANHAPAFYANTADPG